MKIWIYYSLVLLTSIGYIIADFGKSITQLYGVALLIALLILIILERTQNIDFITVGKFLFFPLILPAGFWVMFSGNTFGWLEHPIKITDVGFVWHAFLSCIPLLGEKNNHQT